MLSDRQAEVVVCADVHLPLLQAAGLSPVKLLLCLRSSDVSACARAPRPLKVREVPASFSVSSRVWAPSASAYWLAIPERRERLLTLSVCV